MDFFAAEPPFTRRHRLVWLILIALCILAAPVRAQEEEEDEVTPELLKSPIATIVVSSLEDVKGELKHVFEVSDSIQVYEAMMGGLKSAGDLKGMNQTKPFGAMLFLRNGFPPTPEVIGFVPVEKIEDLTKTIELGPVVTSKVDDNRYEIIGGRRDFQVKLDSGYAFITADGDLLDNEFPNPVRATKALTNKFELAVTLNLDSIPAGMRALFLNYVKAEANAGIQQRDDEPDGLYKIRRAQSRNGLLALTQIMEQLESLTIGLDVDQEKSQASLEIIFDAQENSDLAKDMRRVNSKRSHFDQLIQEEAPFSLSMAAPMVQRDVEQWLEFIDGGELVLASEINGTDGGTELDPAYTEMFEALRSTFKEAEIDMFLQFYGEPGSFSVVGGARLMGGQKINTGLKELATLAAKDIEKFGQMEVDADSHNDIPFHRITPKDMGDAAKAFGDEASLYVGVGKRTGWLAFGGSAAFDKVKELMDKVNERKTGNRTRPKRGPVQLVFNAKQWLGLDEDGEGVGFDAFEDGGDRMTIDVRPTEQGMRIRATVDEGYLRLIGMSAGRRFDRRQERRARRNRERGEGSDD